MSNDVKCPHCGELWDRDFLWTWADLSGGTIEEQRRRFRDLGCNAFMDTSEPCGTTAPTPTAELNMDQIRHWSKGWLGGGL